MSQTTTACTTKARPTQILATLLARFITGGMAPGWDCKTNKAVYKLANARTSGCAVYMTLTPEQRDLISLASNTHESCSAMELEDQTGIDAAEIVEPEGTVEPYSAKYFLQSCQDAHDSACEVAAANGLCGSDPELALETFRTTLVGSLMVLANEYELPWSKVVEEQNKIIAVAEAWARTRDLPGAAAALSTFDFNTRAIG